MNAAFWNEPYNVDDYVYGTEPNAFLKASAAQFPRGPFFVWRKEKGAMLFISPRSVIS